MRVTAGFVVVMLTIGGGCSLVSLDEYTRGGAGGAATTTSSGSSTSTSQGAGGAAGGGGALPCGSFGAPEVLFAGGTGTPKGLAVDATTVFWIDPQDTNIHRVEKDGTGYEALPTDASAGVVPNAIGLSGDSVLFTAPYTGCSTGSWSSILYAMKKTGGKSMSFENGGCKGDSGRQLLVDGDSVFVVRGQGSGQLPGIYRIPYPTGQVTLSEGLAQKPGLLAADVAHLYFTSNGDVYRMPKASGVTLTDVGPQQGANSLTADVDAVYWTTADGKIVRLDATIDPPPAPVVLAEGEPSASGIALDAQCIYWVQTRSGGKVRAMPRSGGAPIDVTPPQASPELVAVDDTGVHWANLETGAIMRAARAP